LSEMATTAQGVEALREAAVAMEKQVEGSMDRRVSGRRKKIGEVGFEARWGAA